MDGSAHMEAHYRQPPHNLEAEQALLGAIFSNNEAYHIVRSTLTAEMFFEPVHGRIFDAISAQINAGRLADPVKLKPQFESDEALADVGGAQYLVRLMASAATVINAPDYAATIRDLHIRRCAIQIGEQMAIDAYDADIATNPLDLIRTTEDHLLKLSTQAVPGYSVKAASDMAEIVELRQAIKEGRRYGISTGIGALDRATGGLAPAQSIIVAGRPAMGKTALACNIARRVAQHREKVDGQWGPRLQGVGIFSFEMDDIQLRARMISDLTVSRDQTMPACEYERFTRGEFNAAEWHAWEQAENRFAELPIEIVDGSMSVADISAEATKMARRFERRGQKLELLVIDYLQLVRANNPKAPITERVTQISQDLKALAKRLRIPVITLSQLSRSCETREDKRPMLSDLRDSGAIEQDADMVIFCYREHYYLKGQQPPTDPIKAVTFSERQRLSEYEFEAIVAKRRMGPTGTAHLFCDLRFNHFRDA